MIEGFSPIMTLEETAKYLKIGKSTLYKMARDGKIPVVKIDLGKNDNTTIRIPYSEDLGIYPHVSKTNIASMKTPIKKVLKEEEM